MALWELTAPVFLGAFLALVCVLMLMGKTAKLLRGPRSLARWINGGSCGPKTNKPYRRQWKRMRKWKAPETPRATTVVAVPTPAPSSLVGTLGATTV